MSWFPISEMLARSGFVDLFVTACGVLYIAVRVMRGDWGALDANRLRRTISWTFYALAVILLVMALTRIPNAERERHEPGVKHDQVPQGEVVPRADRGVPEPQKKR